MYKDLHPEPRSIMLPASVLNALKDLPAGALKVFIYLCSCNQGQPFAATIPTITDATGIQQRSVIAALKTLEEQKLITRIPGSGNQPNQYGIPFPERQKSVLRQAPPPAATSPTRTTTHINAPPSTKSSTAASPTPTPAAILECVAVCYRPINAQELSQLKKAYPDEAVLRKKLARLKQEGGVDPEMHLGFFLQALTQ